MSTISDNGRYVLGRAIGAGGQGEVYEARQLDLDRRVAIKRLREPGQIRHEARILASLRHPNLVTVHELIEVEGQPALVMEYVEGPDLATLLRNADLDPERSLVLWLAVVEGVAHAHRNGVVHGDLSPSNILVEVAQGIAIPKICDFGVGRSLADPLGSRAGTEGFMAPERRDGGPPTARADVYSIAALGRFMMPFEVPEKIDHLLSLSMSPEPSVRPPDASALLEQLDVEREPISRAGLLGRQPGRRRRWGILGGVALVCLGLTVAMRMNHASSGGVALTLAMQRWHTEPAKAAALWHAAGSPVPPNARATGADARVLPHERTVVEVAAHDQQVVTADEDGVIRGWDPSTGIQTWRVDTGVVHPTRLQVDGDHLITVAHRVYGENPSGCVVWSIDSGACKVSLQPRPRLVGLHEGGTLLWFNLMNSGEGLMEGVVDLQTGEILWRREHSAASRVALHPDHPDEVAVLADGLLERVALRSGERTLLREGVGPDWPLVWLDEGVMLVSPVGMYGVSEPLPEGQAAATQRVYVTPVGTVLGGGRSQFGVLHSPQGTWTIRHRGWFGPVAWGGESLLATSPLDGAIELVDARSGRAHRSLLGHERGLLDMTVVGDWLVTASADRTVRLWRPVDRDDGWLRRVDTGLWPVRLVAGERLALLGRTNADVWSVWTEAHGHVSLGAANLAAIDDDATVAAALTLSGDLAVVDLADGVLRHVSLGSRGGRCLTVDPHHDQVLVSGTASFELRRLSDGALMQSDTLGGQPAGCAVLDDAGAVWFASGVPPHLQAPSLGIDIEIPVETVLSGIEFTQAGFVAIAMNGHLFAGDADRVERVNTRARRVNAGAKRFAWADSEGRLNVGGAQPWRSEPRGRVDSLTWAAGEAVLLAGRVDGVIESWSRSGRLLSSVQGHDGRVFGLAVEADSGRVVSVDLEGVLQWWDLSRLTAESAPLVTNYRLCRGTERVVPVVPFPSPELRWAPKHACQDP